MQIDPTLQNLPPSFDRSTESNNWKLMQLAEQPMSKGEDQLNFMLKMRALDTSKKEFLDRIGKLIGVYRGQADDDFYRRMIYARLARRHTDGTINQIYDVVSVILSADPHEFRVRPLWNVTGEPMAIEVLNVPAIYIDSQEKEALLLDQIRSSVAAPTRVAGIGFQEDG
ncbi:baseplate protein [Lactobacillus phage LBR48]|uniref:Putative baseplate protein n=1 Tax=Lactobacillus phage LBR48 TaxID=755164 RepID=D6PT00_9CAUD|nr:baseplate protein [Lactobacillus phage LBR48]ADF83491.1 putative baseplate protein [Lactobacillus phage LBR48]